MGCRTQLADGVEKKRFGHASLVRVQRVQSPPNLDLVDPPQTSSAKSFNELQPLVDLGCGLLKRPGSSGS